MIFENIIFYQTKSDNSSFYFSAYWMKYVIQCLIFFQKKTFQMPPFFMLDKKDDRRERECKEEREGER